MIVKSSTPECARSRCTLPCIIATVMMLLPVGAKAQLPPKSPIGNTWDCLISGARQGIAYLTFDDETGGTFSGVELVVPKEPTASARPRLIAGNYPSNGLGV